MKKITLILYALLCSLAGFSQVTEGFEDGIPATWMSYQTGSDDPGFVITDTEAYEGAQSVFHNDDMLSAESTSWLVTEGYAITDGVNDLLSFYYMQDLASYYVYSGVYVSTASSDPIANPSDFVELQEFNSDYGYSEDEWSEFTSDLSAYEGQTIYVAFKYTGDYNHEFFVDSFALSPVPTCLEPTDLVASNISTSTADLSWTAGDAETSWNVEIVEVGTTPTGTATATGVSNPYSATGLSSGTTYEYYVQADCGDGDLSAWAGSFAFTTECDSFTSLDENFDSVSTPNLANCWGKILDNGASDYATVETEDTYFSAPNGVELYNSSSADTTNIMLVSPMLSNLNSGIHWLKFKARNSSDTQDIEVGTVSDPTDGSTFTVLETVDVNEDWDDYFVDFSSYTGTDEYIAIRRLSTSTYTYVYLDNVVWEEIPSCIAPSDLTVLDLTSTTADLSWTAGGDETSWNVEIVEAGTTPTGTATATGVANPYTATDLAADTAYEFYVQADCGAGDISTWAGPYIFNTECEAFAAPFIETFDDEAGTMPNCWSSESTAEEVWEFATEPTYGNDYFDHTSGEGYFVYVDGSDAVSARTLTTPMIDVSTLSTPMLEFYVYHFEDDDDPSNTITVEVWDGAAWNEVYFDDIADVEGWEEIQIDLSTLNITGDIQARFIADTEIGDNFYNDIGIDDVSFDELPSCLTPSDITASNITATSADLAWTAGDTETAWNIEIVAAGETPTGTPTVSGVTNPYTATELDLIANDYDVYVQADCGEGDLSEWVGPYYLNGYCTSVPSSVDNAGITNFQVGDTDFVAGGEDVTYYSFTDTPVELQQGVESNVQVTFETDYTYDTNIWIDFNDNFQFEESELVFTGESLDEVPTTLDASFDMPLDAALGMHRMRIGTADGGQDPPTPCYDGSYGATADFVVNVTEAPACIDPTDLAVANIFDTSVDFTWTAGGNETEWTIIYGAAGFDPATEGTTVQDNDGLLGETITGLTADTDYEFYVQSICGDVQSSLVGPYAFSTMAEVECGQSQVSNNFENGLFIESGGQELANDFIVNANTTNFSLEDITVNLLNDGGIATMDVVFFQDDNGMPGEEIQTVSGIVPTSQDSIGTAFGYDVHEVVLDLPTAVDFAGDGATDVRYWMQLVAHPTTAGTQVAWETTTQDPIGEFYVYDNDGVEGSIWTLGDADGVFTLNGECTFVTCPFPSNLTVTNLTPTEATIAWNNVSSATAYDWVLVYEGLDPASPLQNGTETDAEVIVSTLESNTAYELYVQSSCSTDEESAWTSISFTTPMGCGDTFVDSGGVAGDYANDEMQTWTFAPSSPTEYVQINFSAVDVEGEPYDILRVYDGPDATYPELSDTEEGVETAGIYTSSTPGGMLTVTFVSDGFVANPGWEATIECVTCIPPTNVVASNVTGTTATISWDAFADATAYEYVVVYEGLDPSAPLFSDTTTETTVDLTDMLDPVTAYDVYVRTDCGDEFSSYAMVNFETPCATFVPNYTEDFSEFVPECWTEASNGLPSEGPSDFGSGSWTHDEYLNIGSTNNAAKVNLYWTGKQEWLISPVFDLSGADDYVAVFETAITEFGGSDAPTGNGMGSDDEVQLLITTDGGLTWENLLTYNQSYYPGSTGTTENIDLSSYTGTAQFAFWATEGTVNDDEDYDFFLNTFSIMSASNPICFEPTGVTISDITSGGATITWDENPYATLGYSYIVVPEGAGTDATAVASDTVMTNTVDITGLDPATGYDVYVMNLCDADSSSEWSSATNFFTQCVAVTEFVEYFDDVTTPDLPVCWDSVIDNGASSFASVETTTGEAYSGANSVEMYNSSSDATSNIMLVAPMVSNLGAGTHWFRFFAMTDTETQDLEIGTLSDPTDGSTFTPIEAVDITSNWEEYMVDFSSYTGTDEFIAIRRLSSETYSYVYIDNAVWEEKPTCVHPMDLVVNSTSVDGANISWEAVGNATGDYQWVVTVAGGDPDVADDVVVSGTSTTTEADITTLESGTTYDFYVMADCGATDGMSAWSAAETFTTAYACGDDFYDTGGVAGNYSENENETWTIYPNDASEFVQISFSMVDIDTWGDVLAVYDGVDTSAPVINGDIETPGVFTSSTPGGPLTVTFTSDGWGSYTGWEALIECVTCIAPVNIEIIQLFEDGAQVSWDALPTATDGYEWVVVAPGGDPTVSSDILASGTTTDSSVDIHSDALESGMDYEVYVMSNCGEENGVSSFSPAVPFTTACQAVDGLTVSEEGFEDVTFTWTPVEGLGYEYVIVEDGDAPIEENFISVGTIGSWDQSTLTVGYLEMGVQYDLYLRIVCDAGFYGEWTTVDFETLGVKGTEFEGFKIYPNPVEDGNLLTLKSQSTIEVVEIYNMLGQMVLNDTPNNLSHEVNMDNLQAGVYMVRITIEGQTGTYRIIKE